MRRRNSTASFPLELTGDAFSELLEKVAVRLGSFLDSLPDQPVDGVHNSQEVARQFDTPLPDRPEEFDSLLEQLFESAFPNAVNSASPGYLAYVPGGGLPHSAIADLMALITNRFVGLWSAAPVVAQIERTVVRWLCEIIGFGAGSGGFLTSGGSLANWSAIVTARHALLPANFLSAAIYTSNQAHHSVARAASLAGFPRENVRVIGVDSKFRIQVDELHKQIAEDRTKGLTPFAIVAHAGTTNTGAVDNLDQVADVAEEEGLWMHVDAAYGGFFMLTEHGRKMMHGISRADSVTLDPHKGMFLPYGTGGLIVQRETDLQRAFAGRGEYMMATTSQGHVDFCDISPELSRDFRGLRIWLPIKMHGISAFRDCLAEKLELAAYACDQLRSMEPIEIVAEPQLSILAFRVVDGVRRDEELNQLNRDLLERINSSGRVYLSPTIVQDKLVLRLCILSFRTHRDRIDECLEIIREKVAEVLA